MGWLSKKKPPETVTAQVLQSPLSRFNPQWAFTYEAKRLPGPGTQNYAYENLGLAEFSPIGPAVGNRQFLRATQPRPDYAYLSRVAQGLGGLSMGTIYGYPLISPPPGTEDQYG